MRDKTDAAFKAAMDKETVEGDLRGAIEQYKKIAQSQDRSIAAKALIRMAECYQKLGDVQARRSSSRSCASTPTSPMPSKPPGRAWA